MSSAISVTPSTISAPAAERAAPQIQSVLRALDIVEALAAGSRPMALSELCRGTSLKPSTCHHLLGTLVARGWVRHDLRSRHYMLGGRMAQLCTDKPAAAGELLPAARAPLQQLGHDTAEAVHLAAMQGWELVTLLKFDSTQAVRVDTGAVGKSQAAHATATGKAMIAWWQAPQLQQLLDRVALTRFTARTITDPTRLLAHLARVRRLGYAEDIEEFQPGVRCVGAPVRGHDGSVVAAVSCSMPTMRARRPDATRTRALVQACVQTISQRLGHRPAAPSSFT